MSIPAEEQERLASVIVSARMLVQGLKSRIFRAVTELDLMQEDPDLPRKFHDVIRDALTQLNVAA